MAALGEEGFEQLGALVGEDAAAVGEAVVEAGFGAELVEGVDTAHLGIVAAVDQFGDAGVDQGTGAHGAGLKGDREAAVFEAPEPAVGGGLAEGEDLGVGGGVGGGFAEVVGGPEHLAVVEAVDDGADGDLALAGRGAGQFEGVLHHGEVAGVVHRRSLG